MWAPYAEPTGEEVKVSTTAASCADSPAMHGFGIIDLDNGNDKTKMDLDAPVIIHGDASLNTPDVAHGNNVFGEQFSTKNQEAVNFDKPNDASQIVNVSEFSQQDILFEFEVPVISNDFDSQWENELGLKEVTFETDPMRCFNPLDVEGKQMIEEKMQRLVAIQPAPTAPKRPRKLLPKLIMPTAPSTEIKERPGNNDVLDTPAVQSMIDNNVQQTGFNLLEVNN
jgi:hypothetical protein